MKTCKWLVPLALLVAVVQPVVAQSRQNFAIVPAFQGYKFPEAAGVTSATLAIIPIGYELALSRTVSLDLYTAYARGDVKIGAETATLQGVVDTRVRASFNVTPWAVVTAGVTVPTGNATHDTEEAVVATMLSTELLGFREALWGTGFGATTGLATAWRAGNTGIGLGASYRLASEFEPSADSAFKYTPGNEVRFRAAIDQNIGANNKLTLGVTFQNYSDDRIDNRELFAPGNRIRGDFTYSFRAGATSSWTLFAADVWRENGDVSLEVVDATGVFVRDSSFQAGQQNMIVLGLAGDTRVGSLNLRPVIDGRLLTRESGEGEGWLAGVGTDIVVRSGGMDWIPSFRVSMGQLEGSTDERHSFWGGEVALALRWGGGR
ncbi:MAG: hypothetical protein ACT4O1_10015 [Gemmatimonadota bacterium]